MSDLISREALLDDIRKTITEKSDTMDWLNMISRQPTAYDVDKVVEQLEELTGEECTMHECGIRSEHCKSCIAQKAIEIVKAGGADE